MMIYAQICRLLKTSSISIESDWKYKPGQEQFAPWWPWDGLSQLCCRHPMTDFTPEATSRVEGEAKCCRLWWLQNLPIVPPFTDLGHLGTGDANLHWGTCSPGKESDELLGKTLQILQDKLVETTETTSIFRQRLSIDIHRPFGFWGFIVLFDITSKESTDKALQIIEDWRHLQTSRVCLGSDVALFNDSLWQR